MYQSVYKSVEKVNTIEGRFDNNVGRFKMYVNNIYTVKYLRHGFSLNAGSPAETIPQTCYLHVF